MTTFFLPDENNSLGMTIEFRQEREEIRPRKKKVHRSPTHNPGNRKLSPLPRVLL
jgi:hypothetical protein